MGVAAPGAVREAGGAGEAAYCAVCGGGQCRGMQVGEIGSTATGLIVSQEAAVKVLAQLGSRTNLVDRIFSRDMFSKEASRAMELQNGLSESDLKVLLKHLARDKGAISYDDQVSHARN